MVEARRNKTIGSINGVWGLLFKLALVIVPMLIPWGVWLTSETFANRAFRESMPRFTRSDGAVLKEELMGEIHQLPPRDWRDRILQLESRLHTIEIQQERILVILEEIRNGN
jgi:hypothetical protein